jgi:F0F1-type ATP synthase membrane subunit b/b'
MESIIDTFYIDWKVIVAQALNFGIVFVVLYFYAIKPLNKIMAERQGKISKGLEDAKVNAKILEETKEHQEDMLARARSEAQTIFQTAKKEAEQKK